MTRFSDKVVIVTGGGSGIGAATAGRFATEGAIVIVADLNSRAANAVARDIRDGGGRCLNVPTDVTDEEAVKRLVELAVTEYGRLDVMVNNAGIAGRLGALDECSAEDWQGVITTNLTGVFYGVKHAARVMKNQQRGGVIINMSSVLGLVGATGTAAYTAAKHAVLGLTKAAALELAPMKIRVVAVAPGFVKTPMLAKSARFKGGDRPQHPLGRLGKSDDVAGVILFLASDEAAFVTGASYLVDGGYTAQ